MVDQNWEPLKTPKSSENKTNNIIFLNAVLVLNTWVAANVALVSTTWNILTFFKIYSMK